MARKLHENVWIDGVLYGPDGEEPSAEVAALITNPLAWGEQVSEEDGDPVPPPLPGRSAAVGDDTGGAPAVTAPPTSGPGSGKQAWAEFAAANGVDVPEDASRDDIVDAVKAAGIAVD